MTALPSSLFEYPLPPELIAQAPAARREESRLLVVNRAAHRIEHRRFAELPSLLRAGDVLFRNDAAVLPARLIAARPSGGRVECFLLRPDGNDREWRCLLKPGRKLAVGERFSDPGGAFRAEVISRHTDGSGTVRFEIPDGGSVVALAGRIGHIPLPPYIEREDRADDRDRYQTVYANPVHTVAVAAPTAGLHFTPDLLRQLQGAGVGFADLTLHVGIGTFRPLTTDTVDEHPIHTELYEMPAATAANLEPAAGKRRIAVGTTSVRTIEDFLGRAGACAVPQSANRGAPQAAALQASIFIYPPYTFLGVDALITNFHLPRSTLLCLVAAFLAPGTMDGIAWFKEIYAEAVRERYRFLSYGDAMIIL